MKRVKFSNTLLASTVGATLMAVADAGTINESPEKWYTDGEVAVQTAKHLRANKHKAKNVILFVADE